MYRPLADKIRPLSLDDIVGQEHILGPDGILRRIILSGAVPNMVFYGPSGSGKTTVANIIASETNRQLYKLNATTASISDIKGIISELDTLLAPNGVLLYLDEIQYFNKKQQQSLLEFMENGKLTLIASTTENPYFYVYNAILSRSTVFEFKQLTAAQVKPAVYRAIALSAKEEGVRVEYPEELVEHIASSCGGDVRKAINAVELLFAATPVKDGVVSLRLEDAQQVTQRSAMRYDQEGDSHYDILSAFQKSIRGSDRTRPSITWRGSCRRATCPLPAAGCWSRRRRTSGLPTRSRSWSPKLAWTAPCSLGFPRRRSRFPRRLLCLRPRQSPTRP